MRKLKTADIPAFCRCLKAIGVKSRVEQIAKEANSAADVWEKGFDLVWNIFDIATEENGEKHIYEFLSGPFEMAPEEIADLDISEFISSVKKLAEENDLVSFFKSAQVLTK